MRLNERNIKRLTAPQVGNKIYRDDEIRGLGIRVTAAGTNAFVLAYSVGGRERRMTLAGWPEWSATAARERAKELRRLIDQGIDPLAEKEHRREALTFADITTEYLTRYAAEKKSGARDEEYLRRDVLPKWGRLKAEDIKRRDIIALVEGKAVTATIAANRLLACVRKVFNWAISRDLLAANPCLQVTAPGKENHRERVLGAEEIRTFWQVLETGLIEKDNGEPQQIAMSGEVRAILRLILATAQRPGECCAMEWSELGDDLEWWTIPAVKAKNARAHRLPLTKLAQEILATRRRGGRYVFAPRGGRPIAVNSLTHALRRNGHLGLEHFTAHDLRRTASDWLARMGIDGRSRSAVLNHKEAGTTERHYTVYTFDVEKRMALQRWGKKLRGILEDRPSEKAVSIG